MHAIIGILASLSGLLGSLILYFIGKILSRPGQIRSFFKLKKENEDESEFAQVNIWIENIGLVVQALAVVSALVSISSLFIA